jgi:hypothetical protein
MRNRVKHFECIHKKTRILGNEVLRNRLLHYLVSELLPFGPDGAILG